jgi:hypothetical protein
MQADAQAVIGRSGIVGRQFDDESDGPVYARTHRKVGFEARFVTRD